MSAGTGAQEQARLARMRVQQKRRKLVPAQRQAHDRVAGAQGERPGAQALAALEAHGYLVLRDVHWPGRRLATLDHVLVGPGGVLVVDVTSWSGDVSVSGGVLRAGGYTKPRKSHDVAAAVASVAALLDPRHRTRVSGVICLAQQDVQPVVVGGVTVTGLAAAVDWCRSRPTVMTTEEVVAVHEHLRRCLAGPLSPDQLSTAQLPSRAGPVREPSARERARAAARPGSGLLPGNKAGVAGWSSGRRQWMAIIALLLLIFSVPRGVVWLAQAYGETVVSSMVIAPEAPFSGTTGPVVPSVP